MTVKDLIEALGRYDGDAPVWTEGCDCWGTASAVVTRQEFNPRDGREHPDLDGGTPADAVLILR